MTGQQPDPSTRTPPFSEDAEISVLAACLIDVHAIAEARSAVTESSFWQHRHRRFFAAMCALDDAETRIDPVTLSTQLIRAGATDEMLEEDRNYVGFLVDAIPTAANVLYHSKIVARFAAQRNLIAELTAAAELAWSSGQDPERLAQTLVSRFLPLASPENSGEGYIDAKTILYALMEDIDSRRGTDGIIGLRTGFDEIDEFTGGFRDGELVGICGLPNAGKSAVLTSFVANHLRDGVSVGIVAAEMGRAPTLERILVNDARVNATAVRKGHLDDASMRRLIEASMRMSTGPKLFIDDTAGPEFRQVVARAHALKIRQPDIRAIYVDYLQLLTDDNETRAEELRGITRGCKKLAKKLSIPVILLAQLNDRDVEKRPDHRARLSDVQGSSGLRQDADFVVLLHRPSMFPDWAGNVDTLEFAFEKTRNIGKFVAILEADMAQMTLRSSHGRSAPPPSTPRQHQLGIL